MNRFGMPLNIEEADSGMFHGRQRKIACKCWFTSTGRSIPLMVEYIDEEGELVKITRIQVLFSERRNYAGIRSCYYRCRFFYETREWEVALLFYPDTGKWMMNLEKDS